MNEVVITFVRHGESLANVESRERRNAGEVGVIGGHDLYTPLTEKGKEQARQAGLYFAAKGVNFTAAYASTAIRAYDTAILCLQALGQKMEVIPDPELLEWGKGDWEGLPQNIYDEALIASGLDKWKFVPGSEIKGESPEMVSLRMVDWTKKIVQEYSQNPQDQHILAVSSSAALRYFLRAYVGETHEGILEMNSLKNTGMYRLTFRGGELSEVQIRNGDPEFVVYPLKTELVEK